LVVQEDTYWWAFLAVESETAGFLYIVVIALGTNLLKIFLRIVLHLRCFKVAWTLHCCSSKYL